MKHRKIFYIITGLCIGLGAISAIIALLVFNHNLQELLGISLASGHIDQMLIMYAFPLFPLSVLIRSIIFRNRTRPVLQTALAFSSLLALVPVFTDIWYKLKTDFGHNFMINVFDPAMSVVITALIALVSVLMYKDWKK